MTQKNFSFSMLGRRGRLGNQLFQIAGTIGLAKIHGAKASFPEWVYEKYFENPLPHSVMERLQVKELHFNHYNWQLPDHADLLGYLQSEKYWQNCIPQIMDQFKFKEQFKNSVFEKYFSVNGIVKDIYKIGGKRKPVIAISIRRGDFVNNSNYAQLPITYYFTALEKYFPDWQTSSSVLIFSDDIEYCKEHFCGFPNVYYCEKMNPAFNNKENYFKENTQAIEQLCAGSMCDHFIISNSTFSWWMAYLGERGKAKIIRPANTFAGNLKKANDTKDYNPQRWISHEETKLDLRDVTFMIPVHYDHPDRKQNLALNVCMLQRYFDTNIVIGEQGTETFGYFTQYGCNYIKYPYKEFHRTKMLNEMAKVSKTQIIVNWDADVFISPLQILKSIIDIRNGDADVVYPYDGRFARVSRQTNFKYLEQALDVGIFRGHMFPGTTKHDKLSVGGAVIFNRASYFKGGGENENFIAYGPEDVEREVRFTRLGYKVKRTPGILYHMDHWKGPNSKCSGNKYDKQNHDELEKIYAFTGNGLREYVDTWPLTKLYK